jgi:hypothetical protein
MSAIVAGETDAPRFRPEIGRSVGAGWLRVIAAAIMVGLSISVIGWQPLLAIALFLSLGALVFPRSPAIWGVIALLAVFSLGPIGAAPDWRFFAVLAGAHLLHVFGMMFSWMPPAGPVQLRVLGRMLRTFVIIQIPAQLVSLLVLTLLAGRSVSATLTSPAFGIVAGIGFVLLVVFVIVPIARRENAREPH